MTKKVKNIVSIFVAFVMAISLASGISVSNAQAADYSRNYGTMRTDITGTQFVAEMGLGWNLGNTFDSSAETGWGSPKITKSMIDVVAAAGFKTFRLPVTWSANIGEAPNYTINQSYLDRIEEVMNYALDNNMIVIINMHHDEWIKLSQTNESGAQTGTALTTEEKSILEDKVAKVWTQIADRFKPYGDQVVFESLNEPREYGYAQQWNGGSSQARTYLNTLNQLIVNTIRATGGNNETRFILTPTYAAGSNTTSMQAYQRPNDPSDPSYAMKRIILSVHAYEPSGLTVGNVVWSSSQLNSVKNVFDANNRVTATSTRCGGMPVVMGEFAWINNDNLVSRELHSQYYVYYAKSKGYACIWWDGMNIAANTNESTGLLIRDEDNPRFAFPTIVEAMMRGLNGEDGQSTGTGVKIDPAAKTVTLNKTTSFSLKAYRFPFSGSQTGISWSSSDTNVATVNSSGTVTVKAAGTTTISATAGGQSGTCVVTVKPDLGSVYGYNIGYLFDEDIEGVTLAGSADSFGQDGGKLSWANVADLGGGVAKLEYKVGKGWYAELALPYNSNNYTFYRNSRYITFDLMIPANAMDTDPEALGGLNNFIMKTGASFTGDEGWKGWWDQYGLKYNKDNMQLIEVNGEPYYWATVTVQPSEAHMTALASGNSMAFCIGFENLIKDGTIYIDNICYHTDAAPPQIPMLCSGIVINETGTVELGSTLALNAKVVPAVARNKTLAWTSSDDEVATVDANGVVSPLVEGEVTITATATDGSGVFSSSVVTITEASIDHPAATFSLSSSKDKVNVGGSFDVSAAFDKAVESNIATISLTYDATKYQYNGFTAADGVSVLDTRLGTGSVRLTVSVADYATLNYGDFNFTAIAAVVLDDPTAAISAKVDYVVRDSEGVKTIQSQTSALGVAAGELIPGDTNGDSKVNLIDLSNLLEMVGKTNVDADWADYADFDFDSNNAIDDYDVIYLAAIMDLTDIGTASEAQLIAATDSKVVRKGGYVEVDLSFDKPVDTNAFMLNVAYDADLFALTYISFLDGTIISLISLIPNDNGATLVFENNGAALSDLGSLGFNTLNDVDLEDGVSGITVTAVMVETIGGVKTITNSSASVNVDTKGDIFGDINGDGVFDLIDLSNLIDSFGLAEGEEGWDLVKEYDLNGSGDIDINDIAELAKLLD